MSSKPLDINRSHSFTSSPVNEAISSQTSIGKDIPAQLNKPPIVFKGDEIFSADVEKYQEQPHRSIEGKSQSIIYSNKFASPPPGFPPPKKESSIPSESASIFDLTYSVTKPIVSPIQQEAITTPQPSVKKSFWLMTEREIRYIWRISMTPIISTLCISPDSMNLFKDNWQEIRSYLYLNKEGHVEYPAGYVGDDYYFAKYSLSPKDHDQNSPKKNLLTLLSQPTPLKDNKKLTVSHDKHLKSILPHVTRLSMRGEKIVDGALGKISLNTLRRPKQSISIEPISGSVSSTMLESLVPNPLPTPSPSTPPLFSQSQSLLLVEKLYASLYIEELPNMLKSLQLDSQLILSLVQTPKGRRLIPTIFDVLSSRNDQSSIFMIIQAIFSNLQLFLSTSLSKRECFSYVQDNDVAAVESIFTPFVPFLSQLPVEKIFDLAKLIVYQPGLDQVFPLSKIPYMVFCIIYSQVEHILQNNKEKALSFEDQWAHYSEHLFTSLLNLFPIILSSNVIKNQTDDDLFYAWQFLALLTAHLSTRNCQLLVNEVREPILLAANSNNPESVRNVNLLLNMVGLDASQLLYQ